jgi:signal peptidase I
MNNKKEEVSLSGSDMMELLRTVHEKGAAFRFKAAGSSMRPSIRNNDMVTVSPLKGIPPFVGEVVAFQHPHTNRLILHRVVRKGENSFFIKGDNLRVIDSHVPGENILGVVTRVERKDKAIFWPDRFRHRFLARCYFKGYITYLHIRHRVKIILRFILTKINSMREE